jgi:cytochrome b6-f complex iron-sulfur subunit
MNRRDVIQRVLVGGAILVVAPSLLQSCSKDSTTDPGGGGVGTKLDLDLSLPANASLLNTGGSLIVQNILVINTGEKYVALTSICTHQGCTVGYNSVADNIQCPCHGSVYSTTGSVINGPAPSALTSYPVKVTGNVISITR